MSTFFHTFMTSGQFHVQAHSSSRAPLLWFVAASADAGGHAVVSLANLHGKWLYGFEAPDRQRLQQLVTAFQAALAR
jgi:hypothetical protein